MSLSEYLSQKQHLVNEQLRTFIKDFTEPGRLQDAMMYSIEAGGKRLRPILLISTVQAFGGSVEKSITTACSLEMIHTYSLIHDDLPAMDDDDLRRGQATNHQKFDEATAILAGDALLTLSFQLIAEDPLLTDRERVFLVQELSKASGAKGMVGGQMQDMRSENKSISLRELKSNHINKTGQLLRFAVTAGAFLGEASEFSRQEITKMGDKLGLIFQIQDDILDVTGEASKIGKPVGSDEQNLKSTYPKLLGLEKAKQQKINYLESAQSALRNANVDHTQLSEIINYLSTRDH